MVLIISDTLMNALDLKNIIRLHKQGTDAANEMANRSLKYLALTEFMELFVPTVYCLSFAGSYIGPNYEIIGGIGSDMWHYEKVSDIVSKMQNILYFMSFEVLRGAAFSLILWKNYGLNMFTAYGYVIRNYGWFLLVLGAYINQLVYGYYFKLSYKYVRIRFKYIRLFALLLSLPADIVLVVI